MARFNYRAMDSNGKIKKGTVEANTEEAAKTKLRNEGLNITEFGVSKDCHAVGGVSYGDFILLELQIRENLAGGLLKSGTFGRVGVDI